MGKKSFTFNQFMSGVIARLKAEGHCPAAHVHRSALRSFLAYMGGRKVCFDEVTPLLLKGYENYLFRNNKSKNTASTYLRALRATYNKAVERRLAPYVSDLFRYVFTGVDAPTKRALEPVEVEQALTAEVPDGLKRSQAYFSLMFLLHGMPFIDLAYLRKCDYKGGVIAYSRHKTGQKLYITLSAEARALIAKYADQGSSIYLFPILRDDGGNYASALRTFNKQLARLAEEVLPGKRLSSYTPRHSWATIAYHLDVSVGVVSRALGHTSIRTTESYLKPMQYEKIDAAHEQVMKAVWGRESRN